MLLTNRAVRILFEAVEAAGLEKENLTRPLGLDPTQLVARGRAVEWKTMAALATQLSVLLDNDEERLRDMGRRMVWTQPLVPLRSIAQSVLSVRSLYEVGARWVFSVILPHLKVSIRFPTPTRMRIRCEVPEPHVENPAFLHVFEGAISVMPELLGHPRAIVAERRLTNRSIELVVDFRGRPSLVTRARRTVAAVLRAPKTFATLEQQRQELSDNIRALQAARDELRVVLDRLPDFVAIHSDGIILWVNRALAIGLGYADASEIVGMPLLDIVAPQCRHGVMERISKPPDAADVPALSEWVIRGRNGQDLMVELAPTQAVVFDGVPARLVVGRDVTERVRMQQKLIVADRLASVGLLAAGVAHEVNNPLGYILNNIELARKELAGGEESAELRRQVLSTALEGVDRIRVIVRDLLLLSRGDDGPLVPTDACAVASSTLALAAREVERTTRIVGDLGPAPLVLASGARLSQVLLNLVGNALEAMRGSPIEQNKLVVRIKRAGDGRVLLEVSDSGNGIPEPDLSRVFEPFFTTKPAGLGTGLGLAIAQRLVVEMGGEISVSSTVGRGTTFRVLLPAAPQQVSSPDVVLAAREQTRP